MKRTGTLLKKGGFTMIEVVAVLVILAVVAAVVAVQMSGTSAYDLASQLEVVKGHLRLAQSRAMGSGSDWGITFNSGGTTYYLFQGSAPTTQVLRLGSLSIRRLFHQGAADANVMAY